MNQIEKEKAYAANMKKLPPIAYADDGYDGVALVKAGVMGYISISPKSYEGQSAEEVIRLRNEQLGVTPAKREALIWGSMFGFHSTGADPDNYDADGRIIEGRLQEDWDD